MTPKSSCKDVLIHFYLGHLARKRLFGFSVESESAHDKTYHKTSVSSKDSDQPIHPRIMAMVLVYHFWDSLEAVKATYDQRRL